jgi:hypothetical protein
VSITVWKATFAASHPLSIIAPVIFHPTQIFLDSVAARWWGASKSAAGEQPLAASPQEGSSRA